MALLLGKNATGCVCGNLRGCQRVENVKLFFVGINTQECPSLILSAKINFICKYLKFMGKYFTFLNLFALVFAPALTDKTSKL